MIWQFIIGGFSLGAVSSLHCVGMCGPLALSLPVHHLSKPQQLISLLLYQAGRIITYSILGLIFGFAGRRIYLAGFQQWFSIAMGMFILFLVIQYWVFKNRTQPSFLSKFYLSVQELMMKIAHTRNSSSFLFFGMANGLLPCAMVYVAIAGALVTAEIGGSTLFMGMFGLGTLPAMFVFTYFGQFVSLSVRNNFKKAVPVFVLAMAVVLILRGMNLGIPFISPALQTASQAAISCH